VIETIVVFIILLVGYSIRNRLRKRRGEIVVNGKKYVYWDKDWQKDPRTGDNVNADGEPYYRGPDGKAYIKGSDGKFYG
jgi:hypothetical protein